MSHRLAQLRQDRDRQVEIRLHRGRVCVHPVPRGLRAALRIHETRFQGSQPKAGTLDLEPFVLSNDTLTIAPGLLSRAMGWLEKRHYQYHVEDQRNVDPLDPQPAAVVDVGHDPGLLSVLRHHTHGTFVVSGRREAVDKVVEVCRCLPTATIGIVTANKHLARHLSCEFRRRVSEHVDCQPGTDAWYTARIRVVPANHLPAFHGQQVEVLIILFDHDAISQKAMERLSDLRPTPRRVYVLRRKGRFSEAEIIALETIAGPTVYVSPHIHVEELQFCTSRSFPDLPPARDLHSRQKIWQHKARNHWIAGIAQACAEKNLDMLWAEGLYLRDQEELPNDPSVVILVESKLHGWELVQYLPGWDLQTITGGTGMQSPQRRILTLARAAEYPFAANVIIFTGTYCRALPKPVHYHGRTTNVIVIADGLFNTRLGGNKAYAAITASAFPVISVPSSLPGTPTNDRDSREPNRSAQVTTRKAGKETSTQSST